MADRRDRDERIQKMFALLRGSMNHLDELNARLWEDPTLPLKDGEQWLPADIEFARRFSLQYTGPRDSNTPSSGGRTSGHPKRN